MALPKGYTKVEYIQSSGTQYIDTGFVPDQNTRVVAKLIALVGSATQYYLGARTGINSNSYAFTGSSSGYYLSGYGTVNGSISSDFNRTEAFVLEKNKNVTYIDGAAAHTASTATFTAPGNMYLFAVNQAGSAKISESRFYYCKIYNNGTLVRDYVPCVKLSGEAGLYDLVNDVFYGNAGSGVFTVGKYVLTWDEIIPLEYIESNGAQYVDTGFYPKYNSRVVMDVSGLKNQGLQFPFGAKDADSSTAANQFALYRNSGTTFRSDYFGGNSSGTVLDSTVRTTIDYSANVCTMYGITITASAVSSGAVSYPLYLFASNTAGAIVANAYAIMRLYACQIYDNGAAVRDYIPAKLANGAVGLWNSLDGVFYTDAAGGSFIAGPELAVDTPTDFEQVLGVCLRWSAVDCEGYRLYRDGEAIAETTNTFYADLAVASGETYTYSVTAYRGTTESEPAAEIEVYTRTGYFVIKPLIQSAFFQ